MQHDIFSPQKEDKVPHVFLPLPQPRRREVRKGREKMGRKRKKEVRKRNEVKGKKGGRKKKKVKETKKRNIYLK